MWVCVCVYIEVCVCDCCDKVPWPLLVQPALSVYLPASVASITPTHRAVNSPCELYDTYICMTTHTHTNTHFLLSDPLIHHTILYRITPKIFLMHNIHFIEHIQWMEVRWKMRLINFTEGVQYVMLQITESGPRHCPYVGAGLQSLLWTRHAKQAGSRPTS